MRRPLPIGIDDVDHRVDGSKHLYAESPIQDMPLYTEKSGRYVNSTPVAIKHKTSTESSPYSLSERKLRANAFAGRVHSLKYYIGLIGAKSII